MPSINGRTQPAARLLVVEDEKDDFFLVRMMLGQQTVLRYELEWAPSFRAGLAALEKKRFDAALVDYRLGGESGIDWLRAVRAAGNAMPIILLTAIHFHYIAFAAPILASLSGRSALARISETAAPTSPAQLRIIG